MIFKRAVAKLRAQDWAAIAIELGIVVLGVFIGVQAANWNDAMADRSRSTSYLERIGEDLSADIENYGDRSRFWVKASEYGAQGIRYAERRDAGTLDQWHLLLAYFQASQVAEFFTTDITYEELKSAGELGLIDDLDLRKSLALYYTNSGNPALSERPAYRMHVRGIIPLDLQEYIWSNCYRSDDRGVQQLIDCPSPTDEARARQIVDRIAGDEALMAELRYWLSTLRVARLIGADRIGLARKMKAKIDANLRP